MALRRFLEEHGGAIEADIPRYWPGRRLRELFTGDMTWRELAVFIRHLPRESATSRELFGEVAAWSPDTHLLADLWDVYVSSHMAKGHTFKPYPRPAIPDDDD